VGDHCWHQKYQSGVWASRPGQRGLENTTMGGNLELEKKSPACRTGGSASVDERRLDNGDGNRDQGGRYLCSYLKTFLRTETEAHGEFQRGTKPRGNVSRVFQLETIKKRMGNWRIQKVRGTSQEKIKRNN